MVCPIDRICFCGVGAIAGITGISVKTIEQKVLEYRKTTPPPKGHRINAWQKSQGIKVLGMWDREVLAVLEQLGYDSYRIPIKENVLTAGQFLKIMDMKKHYIIHYTGHYIAVGRGLWCDNLHRQPASINTFTKTRKKVYRAYNVYAKT